MQPFTFPALPSAPYITIKGNEASPNNVNFVADACSTGAGFDFWRIDSFANGLTITGMTLTGNSGCTGLAIINLSDTVFLGVISVRGFYACVTIGHYTVTVSSLAVSNCGAHGVLVLRGALFGVTSISISNTPTGVLCDGLASVFATGTPIEWGSGVGTQFDCPLHT